jgi:CHAT domain-containing protein
MLKNKYFTILLGFSSLFACVFLSPSLAQMSQGTAGFSSGAGNTTSSNTTFSVPSSDSQSKNDQLSSPIKEGKTPQGILSIIQSSAPTFSLETNLNTTFENHLALPPSPPVTLEQTKSLLQQLNGITGVNQGIIYVSFAPSSSNVSQLNYPQTSYQIATKATQQIPNDASSINPKKNDTRNVYKKSKPFFLSVEQLESPVAQPKLTDELQVLMVTSQGVVPLHTIQGATRSNIFKAIRQFEQKLSLRNDEKDYLPQAKQLYQWIIAPIEQQLQAQNIENITFVLDDGLRTLPIAALYNEKTNKYVIEDYSVGLMPSLSLTDLTPRPRRDILNTKVLAMGAETFTDQKPLPSVPFELREITQNILTGNAFLNQDFTVDNLKKSLMTQDYNIVHLATHGEFRPGDRSNSYIYFTDRKMNLEQFSKLGLDNPKIDLLVLSACRTAFGDKDAELGFAGLAIKTGARTVLGSLWYVSDEATLALMSMFYENLKTTPMKAESLRQAQLAFLKGNITIQNNELILDNNLKVKLSPELAKFFSTNKDLRNPYYWGAFTLIGNPW